MTTQCPWTRILTSEPRFDWDVSDRGRRRQGKLLFKKWICVFSTFIAIIPTHLYCRMYAHSFGIEFLRALLEFKKKKVWCTCKIVLLLIKPIGFLKFLLPHRRPPYCLPTHPRKKLTLHTLDFISLCVLTERIRETSMEPKFSRLKLSADIPPKTFFGKLSTLENIVTGDEGKKSSDKKKSYNRKLTKNLNSDIENEKIQTFKYKKKWKIQ